MTEPQTSLLWRDSTPVSRQFDDVYFSVDNGLAETRYVFLDQNHLKPRWQSETDEFTILETGFGTGLNFLATVQRWLASNTKGTLHFVSIEKYPLTAEHIQQAINAWPELSKLCETLCEQLPPAIAGWHSLHFPHWNIRLTLIYDDVQKALCELKDSTVRADAIYLDGFAPAKNPDMWTDGNMVLLGHCAAQNASVATFTAVGRVRRALQAAGFTMEKVKGFGRKREMLCGRFKGQIHSLSPSWNLTEPLEKPETTILIGAGIAGCHIAHRLANQGIHVTVLEAESEIANGASGNPQGIVFVKLSASDGDLADFSLSAYLHATRFYSSLYGAETPPENEEQQCGMLYLLNKEEWQKLRDKFEALSDWVTFFTPEQASIQANTTIEDHAIWLEHGQWLQPSSLCQKLLRHPNITLITDSHVESLANTNDSWHVKTQCETYQANTVVIANAYQSRRFTKGYELPIRPAAGQITAFDHKNQPLEALKTIVCGKAYIAPSNSTTTIGATFRMNSEDCEVIDSDHQQNCKAIKMMLPEFDASTDYSGRTSVRTASTDYIPLVGPVPDINRFCEQFEQLGYDAKLQIDQYGATLNGLYLFTGLGSRGLSYSPLCADILCNTICQKPLHAYPRWQAIIHPARFLIRGLKRRKTEQYYA